MNELRELNKFKRIHDNNHQDSECYMLSIGDRAMIKQDFSLLAELLIVLPRMAVGPRRDSLIGMLTSRDVGIGF